MNCLSKAACRSAKSVTESKIGDRHGTKVQVRKKDRDDKPEDDPDTEPADDPEYRCLSKA